jgi:hypothetical protein
VNASPHAALAVVSLQLNLMNIKQMSRFLPVTIGALEVSSVKGGAHWPKMKMRIVPSRLQLRTQKGARTQSLAQVERRRIRASYDVLRLSH